MSIVTFQKLAERRNQMLYITSVATGHTVSFPAFIDRFEDNYQVGWGSEESFGRVDPVKPYRGTSRRVTLAIAVLSPDAAMAEQNFSQYSRLIQMLYPVYSDPLSTGGSLARTIKAPPILKVKLMNYIQSAAGGDGLIGCINGLTFDPDFSIGHFVRPDGTILPQKFTISFSFEPQHDSEIGFNTSGDFLTAEFPYSQPQVSSAQDASDSTTPTGRGNINSVLGTGLE
jgi:hypothetical protein|tara:strand:+ start:18726 stop:19409 length:684 start_codon:yes stop_codon:yes gene_type:complete